jgi:hypothetical protein
MKSTIWTQNDRFHFNQIVNVINKFIIYNLKVIFSIKNCEEGLISNTGISKTGISKVYLSYKWVARRNATGISNLSSKTALSKLPLGTKLY